MKIRMRTNLNTKKRVISAFDLNGEYIWDIEWDVIAIIRSSNILVLATFMLIKLQKGKPFIMVEYGRDQKT